MAYLVSVAAVIIMLIFWLANRKQHNLPPGPWKMPILGNLHQLLGKQPHLALTELCEKYGPLMSIHLGSVLTVVASSPATVKLFLQTHDHVFSSRPRVSNAELFTYGFSDVMWAPYTQQWRELRKICVLELFTARRIESFQDVRRQEIFSMIQRLSQAAQGSQVVNLKEKLTELAWSVIARMVSNRQTSVDIEEGLEIKSTIDKALELTGAFNIADYISFMRGLDIQGFRHRAKGLHRELDVYFQGLLNKHRQEEPPQGATEDFIDVLTLIQEQNGKQSLSDDQIKATIQDVIAAGTDTSSLTLEWALTELVRHPRALETLQVEIHDIVGTERLVEESDLTKLSYLQAVLKETLRLHIPGPLLQHASIKDCEVEGYHLPAGTRVIINLYAISRDPACWENPSTFRPERFLEHPSIDVKGQNFEFIPFGSGRRICPAQTLAYRTAQIALAQLVHCFNWETPQGEVPDVDEICGLTLPKAKPLLLIPTPRLHDELYLAA